MTEWQRASQSGFCGYCAEVYYRGDPLLVLTGGSWRKVRCRKCAGEPVPALPGRVERREMSETSVASMRDAADGAMELLGQDFKLKQAHDEQ